MCEVYINRRPHYFLSIFDRFMCSLSLFLPFHSLPLSHRAMSDSQPRNDRETKKAQNRLLSCIYQKKQHLCSRLLTKFVKTSNFRQ